MIWCANQNQWHVTKVKYHISIERITYMIMSWERVLMYIKICPIAKEGLLDAFDHSWGAREFLR